MLNAVVERGCWVDEVVGEELGRFNESEPTGIAGTGTAASEAVVGWRASLTRCEAVRVARKKEGSNASRSERERLAIGN
jgi:hypothetical protein